MSPGTEALTAARVVSDRQLAETDFSKVLIGRVLTTVVRDVLRRAQERNLTIDPDSVRITTRHEQWFSGVVEFRMTAEGDLSWPTTPVS